MNNNHYNGAMTRIVLCKTYQIITIVLGSCSFSIKHVLLIVQGHANIQGPIKIFCASCYWRSPRLAANISSSYFLSRSAISLVARSDSSRICFSFCSCALEGGDNSEVRGGQHIGDAITVLIKSLFLCHPLKVQRKHLKLFDHLLNA